MSTLKDYIDNGITNNNHKDQYIMYIDIMVLILKYEIKY